MPNGNFRLKEYLETLPPAAQSVAKSELSNILRVNPWLSKLCGAYFQTTGCNPFHVKNLQPRSEIFFNQNLANPKGNDSMAVNKNARICTHIKPSGHRCGSPALRGEIFCYFHQRMIRGVRTPPNSRLHPIAILEDSRSIQASLMEIINALVRNTIDYRRAQLILRALHMAARNERRASFDSQTYNMVDEVPEYAAPRESKKRKSTAEKPAPAQKEDEFTGEPELDWKAISKKIEENTYYEPPRQRPIATESVDPTRRKPPASVKLPQSENSFGELASKILAELPSP